MNNFHQSKVALGSEVTLTLVSDHKVDKIDPFFNNLWDIIESFENRFSRFLKTSELSLFNERAGTKQHISSEFSELLKLSNLYSNKTEGLFNIFILPALQKSGYIGSFIDKEREVLDFQNRNVVEFSNIKIGDNWAFIPYGTAIDLGGIGKGYLADKLSNFIKNKGMKGYWFSLGGDIVCEGVNSEGKNWSVKIADAINPNNSVATFKALNLNKFAIATSGITKRQGTYNGNAWHHIIDPRTNKPAITNIKTITICCNSGVEADILVKCGVILGSDNIKDFYQKNKIKDWIAQYQSDIDNDKLSFKINGNLIELEE